MQQGSCSDNSDRNDALRRLNEASEANLAAKARLDALAPLNANTGADDGSRQAEFGAAEENLLRTTDELSRAAEAYRRAVDAATDIAAAEVAAAREDAH